ncbi:tRNA (adenosine(37)-N6)-threonylcarbamoyltransferase complex ATPase subunit type 1 TsaE [Lacihabitans sp. LS3-19]|uniref:tRNA (adenosine(37)-N6)-threonylcarbamoyltransferase complex ATPase subunit type 1 TsaE n=1 Tax=Lacihabitans sp. LS3-19 TaxID=2487335 RepID=UPI0020CF88A9|nr:tRNA (adenosine(37)-N6)-threonylcarbamoyltransferase complex ATPase subunit type 1 TsaE [Lacihabitans sp. LS3-19]
MDFLEITEPEISAIVPQIFDFGKEYNIWTFSGNLGAGKTTLIKALANFNGIKDPISSPTFGYVNQYDDQLYHFDCYRLKDIFEAMDFGMEEYLDSGKRCWIEWPEVIENLLPIPYMEIKIEHNKNNSRNIHLNIIK